MLKLNALIGVFLANVLNLFLLESHRVESLCERQVYLKKCNSTKCRKAVGECDILMVSKDHFPENINYKEENVSLKWRDLTENTETK